MQLNKTHDLLWDSNEYHARNDEVTQEVPTVIIISAGRESCTPTISSRDRLPELHQFETGTPRETIRLRSTPPEVGRNLLKPG